ncbi:hypothetical protein Agabi119p4_3969 [Agaricus bisporus var. burnettii]|uniref:Uncharacterized protein n=1 Tax=Agaricus bisporus var. burnettii TaxID=192524 RepID=A0A8H7F5S0_AGABI|nr:hypothetical protein Agabi119p4_3969 [Agaricus bisporus var. burnettii]
MQLDALHDPIVLVGMRVVCFLNFEGLRHMPQVFCDCLRDLRQDAELFTEFADFVIQRFPTFSRHIRSFSVENGIRFTRQRLPRHNALLSITFTLF